MEEAGGPGRPPRSVRPSRQLDDRRSALHPEAHHLRVAIDDPQADRLLVEGSRAIEVGDVEANRPDAPLGGHDRVRRRRNALARLGLKGFVPGTSRTPEKELLARM